jgi:hypothetical protein
MLCFVITISYSYSYFTQYIYKYITAIIYAKLQVQKQNLISQIEKCCLHMCSSILTRISYLAYILKVPFRCWENHTWGAPNCVCIYHRCIHTNIQTYKHTNIHTYIDTYKHTYIHACIHTYIHSCILKIYTYILHIYIYTYIFMCVYIYIYVCTYIHACIHTYIHTLT